MAKISRISRHTFTIQSLSIAIIVVIILLGVSQINQVQQLISKASWQAANLVIDASQLGDKNKKVWANFAQGGESPDYSFKPILDQVKKLEPEYIRVDHLYDFYIKVNRDESGNVTYDFTKLNKLLDEIKAIGAKPFISLSYTPDILSSDITGKPSNWSEYQQIIKTTVEHISGKNKRNISNVYYEVWNEPDLFGQWKTYGEKNYLEMYESAVSGAQQASNVQSFRIGGPATTKLYKNWIIGLIDIVLKKKLRLDFISWHHYTDDVEEFKKDNEFIKDLMINKYPEVAKNIEIIISEWGPYSDIHQSYDSNASAAHLVSTISEMTPTVDRAFVFEIQDGKDPQGKEYWGRWGMFTHQSFGSTIKPRAKAIELLNRLSGQKMKVSGEGSYIKALAAKDGAKYKILISNYDPENTHAEEVPITITNVSPGQYYLSIKYLGRSKTTKPIEIVTNQYQFIQPMPANSVVLLELEPR